MGRRYSGVAANCSPESHRSLIRPRFRSVVISEPAEFSERSDRGVTADWANVRVDAPSARQRKMAANRAALLRKADHSSLLGTGCRQAADCYLFFAPRVPLARLPATPLFALDVHGVVGNRLGGDFLEPVRRLRRNRDHVALGQMVRGSPFGRGSAHLVRSGLLGFNHGSSHY